MIDDDHGDVEDLQVGLRGAGHKLSTQLFSVAWGQLVHKVKELYTEMVKPPPAQQESSTCFIKSDPNRHGLPSLPLEPFYPHFSVSGCDKSFLELTTYGPFLAGRFGHLLPKTQCARYIRIPEPADLAV